MKLSIIIGALIIAAAIITGSYIQAPTAVPRFTIKKDYLLDKDTGHVWYMTTKKNLERDQDEAELVLIKVNSIKYDPASKQFQDQEGILTR